MTPEEQLALSIPQEPDRPGRENAHEDRSTSPEPEHDGGGASAAEPRGAPIEPTPEQRAAIEARAHDAFLEAGAGTGKTAVLVSRYCEAIAEDDVEVDRILAFTFTERAAAELRTRVRRELTRRARAAREGGDDAEARRLLRAARATERAWVMTIHAFCRRLLGAHPLAAGLDPRFRVLDASESARLRDEAANAALDHLLAAGDEEVARAASAYQPWRLAGIVVDAHERLRSQGMSEPALPEVPDPVHSPTSQKEARRELTAEELEAARSGRGAVERVLEEFHRRYEAAKEERSALDFQDLELRALELLRTSEPVARGWRGRFAHVMVDEFQDTNSVQLELVNALRGDETKVFMVGDEHQSIYRFRNADLAVFREERSRAERSPTSEVLPLRGNFRSLPAVLAAVNQVGRTLLDGFAELRAGVTDEGEGEIELLLTLDEGRAADARKWAQEEIDLAPAATNSPPKVIAEARFLARRLREIVDAGEAERGEIVVLLRAFTHVDAYEEALKRAGLRPFVVGGRGYWTQQQVEDLVRLLGVVSNPLDDEYLFGALASFASGVSPDALWLLRRAATRPEGRPRPVWPVVEWRFANGPEPPWRDSAGEAPRDEEWLDAIAEEDRGRLRRFARLVGELRAQAPILALDELVERTMNAFGYDLGLIAREGGAGRMANVRKLMRLASEYEANEGRDLAGFLAAAAASTERDEREGMAAVQAEDHDGVRVMTVHAAKGLQFPVVAVPDLGRALNAGHRNGDLVIGRPAGDGRRRFGMRLAFPASRSLGLWELADLQSEESDAEAEEGCRLVYVAASRAERRLLLSGCYGPKDLETAEEPKAGDSPLRRLLPALVELGYGGGEGSVALPGPMPIEGSERLPDATLRISLNEPDPERARELVRTFPPPTEPDPLASASARPPILDEREAPVPVGHLSYSALALYERCGYRFYLERVLGVRETAVRVPAAAERPETESEIEPEPGSETALAVGKAVHAALEWSARNGWNEPPNDHVQRLLAGEGLGGSEDALARARQLIAAWLGSRLCEELRGAPTRAEVPFVLSLGGTVVRGQIDLLAAGRDGEPPTVVDYKTDALSGRPVSELAGRYRAQREVYALATGAKHGARAIHVFLEAPDEPHVETFDAEGLGQARRRLEDLVGRMRAGEFEPTAEPHPALCFGCPAAARLCPHPAWKPPR